MLSKEEIFNELIRCDRDLLDKKLSVKAKIAIKAEADTLRWVLDKDLDEGSPSLSGVLSQGKEKDAELLKKLESL